MIGGPLVNIEQAPIQVHLETMKRIRIAPTALISRPRVMVALVIGQSHAANYGESPRTPKRDVYNFYKGNLYLAQDPLLGADHDGGSVWTRLGDILIERNLYDAVVFVPVALGGTEMARWHPGGDLHRSILDAIDHMHRQGLSPTHLLWHQGENDNLLKTGKDSYKRMFSEMLASIRAHGVNAPIYVSIATLCGKHKPYLPIQEAQAELIDRSVGIYPGPNTDTLGLEFRYDGCHFSDEGLDREAELWVASLAGNDVSATLSSQTSPR
ncbi:MAG TPA: sialate O-acetylesterase [Nitrospiraceae bacterium]|nr:sialate O-acetylesterase [Nitrospiraceae bacterium]